MKSKVEVKKMIVESASEVLNYLEELTSNENDAAIFNLILTIKSELSDLNKLKLGGNISLEEYRRILSKIRLNILNITEEIPDRYFSRKEEEAGSNAAIFQNENIYIEVFSLIRQLADIRIQEINADSSPSAEALHSHLNSSRHILVNQIIKLVEVKQFSLSSVEYRIIAEAFQAVYDNVKAEEYFKRAIETIDEYTDSTNSKIVAIRSYAGFLYLMNKPEEGAKQFASAILNNTNDISNNFNGYTFQMQFANEVDVGNYDLAIECYKKAKAYYLKIGNIGVRDRNLSSLENTWNYKNMPTSFSKP